MCEFEVRAVYCHCFDRKCKFKVAELGETHETHAGHIEKVVTVFRTYKPTCLGMFTNNDPDRLLVRWGTDPENANSKQDCTNARYVIADTSPEVFADCCQRCKEECNWEGSPALSEAGSGAGA